MRRFLSNEKSNALTPLFILNMVSLASGLRLTLTLLVLMPLSALCCRVGDACLLLFAMLPSVVFSLSRLAGSYELLTEKLAVVEPVAPVFVDASIMAGWIPVWAAKWAVTSVLDWMQPVYSITFNKDFKIQPRMFFFIQKFQLPITTAWYSSFEHEMIWLRRRSIRNCSTQSLWVFHLMCLSVDDSSAFSKWMLGIWAWSGCVFHVLYQRKTNFTEIDFRRKLSNIQFLP